MRYGVAFCVVGVLALAWPAMAEINVGAEPSAVAPVLNVSDHSATGNVFATAGEAGIFAVEPAAGPATASESAPTVVPVVDEDNALRPVVPMQALTPPPSPMDKETP